VGISSKNTALFQKQVERRSINSLSYNEFVHEFVLPGIPLVITESNQTNPISNWCFKYFLNKIDHHSKIEVNKFSIPFDHASSAQEERQFWQTLHRINRRRTMLLPHTDTRHNIVDWNFVYTNPELLKDYVVPDFFSTDLSTHFGLDEHTFKWIYFGEQGTGTNTHVDVLHSSAWLFLSKGKKQWRFVDKDCKDLFICDDQRADLFDFDLQKYPKANSISGYELIQLPGEIVWTPPKCLHGVRNLEPSIALTHNYVDLTNLAEVFVASTSEYCELTRLSNTSLIDLISIAIKDLERRGIDKSLLHLLLRRMVVVLEGVHNKTPNIQVAIDYLRCSID
jgi:hypothetical protein